MKIELLSRIVSCAIALGTLLPIAANAQTPIWKRQLGTPDNDTSNGVAVDTSGNVYITGNTSGALAGAFQGGVSDAWVAKFNSSGKIMWKRQLGTSNFDDSYGVAVDTSGNVYITGDTGGALFGANQGYNDAWVAKFNTSGKLLWKRQLGTFTDDTSKSVAVDTSGNVYITGGTGGALAAAKQGGFDAWVAKFNDTGKLLWLRQLGSSTDDGSNGVAVDTYGNVYITGGTLGALGGANQGSYDAWVAKFNDTGKIVWKRQLGTSSIDGSRGVAVDTYGNVYISGSTSGSLAGANQRADDAWVAKFNTSGKIVWKRQLGTSNNDASYAVAVDSYGNVYISGYTFSASAGANQRDDDAWLAKLNDTGKIVWLQQLGTSESYGYGGVAADTFGNVYITGSTNGAFAGANQGNYDAWVAKYPQTPPEQLNLRINLPAATP